MKINVDRLYTYPVLAEGRDDYKTCKFSAKVNYFSDATDNLVLDVDFSTNCAEIKNLIADGKAEYLLHTECQLTALRKNFTSAVEKFSCKIPFNSVKQNLECLALIVLTEDLKNFSCKDWSEDFDWLKFDLKKGNVLAYQNFQPLPFPDDPNILKKIINGIVKFFKHFKDLNKSLGALKESLRPAIYELNKRGGAVVLDCLTEEEIAAILIEHVEKNYFQSSRAV